VLGAACPILRKAEGSLKPFNSDFGTLSGLWVAEINDERDSAVTVNRNWSIGVGLVDSNLWRKLVSLEKAEYSVSWSRVPKAATSI
jgi:hypothetical protein